MNLHGHMNMAFTAIGRNRLRSGLALLGIAIGVAVVVTMVAVGAGAQRAVELQIRAAGVNAITVTAGNFSMGDQDPTSGDVGEPTDTTDSSSGGTLHISRPRTPTWAGMSVSPSKAGRGASASLSLEDAAAIERAVAGVSHVAAGVMETAVTRTGTAAAFTRLSGAEASLFDVRAITLGAGRFLTDRDVKDRARVVVLSKTTSEKLFGPAANPVGASVRIRQRDFRVIGVTGRLADLAGSTAGATDDLMLPITTLQDLLQISYLHSIEIAVVEAGQSTRVALDVTRLLRERHGLGPDDPDDFVVRTQARDAITGKGINPLIARAVAGSVVNLDAVTLAEIASTLERSSRTMTALLTGVASVSLLVGGIGIMNVMLVSVVERTPEIGLRMAVGARGRDVLLQFLIEAIALSLAGGIAGAAAGVAASRALTGLMKWTAIITPTSIAVSVMAAAATGVFFGFYPARRAALMQPLDALRFE
ncbi:MAG TPA: ABC transporter permease [Vicinamibacterales bacterium]